MQDVTGEAGGGEKKMALDVGKLNRDRISELRSLPDSLQRRCLARVIARKRQKNMDAEDLILRLLRAVKGFI